MNARLLFLGISALGLLLPIGLACECDPPRPKGCGPPIVNAGEDQTATVGDTVILRGSFRLPDENRQVCVSEKTTLLFVWEVLSGPDVELDGANQREASFVPLEEGVYKFRIMAIYPVTEFNKEEKASQWDTTTVTVEPVICDPPVADAGTDQWVSTPPGIPRTVDLDGSASHPTNQAGCNCSITAYTWTREDGPAVTIANPDQAVASVDVTEPGDYVFKLAVQDDCGTEGRQDTGTDTVTVTLQEQTACEAELAVKAVDAGSGAGVADAQVIVVDAAGAEHTATTDGDGLAVFSSLADGARQSISVVASGQVEAWDLSQDPDPRPKYETTTVVGHCGSAITIPLLETRSGQKSGEWGTVVGKVSRQVFSMLPHSWHCLGACITDADCNDGYYCQTDPALPCGPNPPQVPDGSCAPISLLPFFSLGDLYISGQFRVAITLPLYPVDNLSHFPVGRLFAPPPEAEALLPGNLSTDDAFLNGLAPTLGLDPWGQICVSTSDCGSPEDYVCEQDSQGEYRCKDKHPLRNIKMDLPAGENVRIIVLLGIINVNLLDLLPVLLPMMTDGGDVDFDVGALLGAFKFQTLHICPIMVEVVADQQNDISADLAQIDLGKCWNVDYNHIEAVIGLESSASFNLDPCITDDDCCASPTKCGWPVSGKKCLVDPLGGSDKCYTPLFREKIVTGDTMALLPASGGFPPTAVDADDRLCLWSPGSAEFEKLCETDQGIYIPCDPREFCNVDVPANAECSFPYGLALTALDVPAGNDKLPEGGRVGAGFDFNITPLNTNLEPDFLIPNLAENNLTGTVIQAVQLYLRNVTTLPDGSYEELPGRLGVAGWSGSNTKTLPLPEVLPLLEPDSVPDAGMDVKVTFVTDDPTVCPPVLERTYTAATNMRAPQSGAHDLPATAAFTVASSHELVGLTLAKVDRVQPNQTEYEIVDSWWRIYAPRDTASITLPASASPFSTGMEVWLGFWASSFKTPFDFSLFTTRQILTGQRSHTKDDYALIAP